MSGKNRKFWTDKIENLIQTVCETLDEKLDLRKIAGLAAASPYHFHRNFKAYTGETPADFVRRLRLERAVYLIRKKGLKITDAGLESGFETPESFSKAFQSVYGMAPSRMRKLKDFAGTIPSNTGIHYHPTGNSRLWYLLKKEGDDSMQVKITQIKPMRFAVLHCLGDYWQFPEICGKVVGLMMEKKAIEMGSQFMILFHDHHDGVPMEKKRTDAGFSVGPDFQPFSGIEIYDFPGGEYAVTPHFGSPEEIGFTWDKWRKEWLPESGWTLDTGRPSLEWYQNSGENLPPELQLVLLCDPVRKS